MTSLTNNLHPQQTNFFSLQTTRLSKSFELLTRSVALTGPEKFPRKTTCDPVVLARTASFRLASKVLSAVSVFQKFREK